MPRGSRELAGSGTRIASISGLRGVVGDGLDPSVAVEFAAAYTGGCKPGPIVFGHDARMSASVFVPAVESSIMATGHDVLYAGAAATPTIGLLVRHLQAAGGIQISASHNPARYNGLKFFQARGWSSARRRATRCSIDSRSTSFAGRGSMRLAADG